LSILAVVGPVIVARHMKPVQKLPISEIMIKVKGTIKHQTTDNIVYLKGDNGLYYALLGNKLPQLLKNIDKSATVFGNIIVPNSVIERNDNTMLEGKPIRMRVEVVNFHLHKK
jgi:hypothetical protein